MSQTSATQTTLDEQTSKNQPSVQSNAVNTDTPTDTTTIVDEGQVNELDTLRQEVEAYKQKDIQLQQKDMSEDQKEIDTLKKELHDLAKQDLISSKYFKEQELADYSPETLKGMNELLKRMGKSGQPGAPPRVPTKETKKKELMRQRHPGTGEPIP